MNNYIEKPANILNSSFQFKYMQPSVCPHCGTDTDAIPQAAHSFTFNGLPLIASVVRCTRCNKEFFFTCYLPERESQVAPTVCKYPDRSFVPYVNHNLESFSSRFIDLYNQALMSEYNGNFELAAIGFRSALEFLLKDFAISILEKPENEVITKSLSTAISDYLDNDLVNTADVVRILGNDYTHYERKYPQYDFLLLKQYMGIFLTMIEQCFLAKRPPVKRSQP